VLGTPFTTVLLGQPSCPKNLQHNAQRHAVPKLMSWKMQQSTFALLEQGCHEMRRRLTC
jgi:hypothetical protein